MLVDVVTNFDEARLVAPRLGGDARGPVFGRGDGGRDRQRESNGEGDVGHCGEFYIARMARRSEHAARLCRGRISQDLTATS